MFAKMRFPITLAPAELDNYLARGWFRMRQTIFTTNFLHFDNQFYSVIWLRIGLNGFSTDNKKFKALAKANTRFKTEIKRSMITAEHEALYQRYKEAIRFDISSSLHELLVGSEAYNRYDTYEVNIYDEEKLIASGIFDMGRKSAAGITCFYHPDYKKYSLGKYLMYLKMEFCSKKNIQYFYPGYLVPGYKAFDYKADVGKEWLEFLQLSSQQWIPYNKFSPVANPLHCMKEKLHSIKPVLEKEGIVCTVLFYKFFDATLDPGYYGNKLFDYPVFLFCFSALRRDHYHLIVYDVRDEMFHLLQCSSIIHLEYFPQQENIFSSGLLKIDRYLLSTQQAEDLPSVIQAYL